MDTPPHVEDVVDDIALGAPPFFEHGEPVAHPRAIGLEIADSVSVVAPDHTLARERTHLRVDRADLAPQVLDRRRLGRLPDRDARACGIEHADGLVGQLARSEVAGRQAHRVLDRVVEDVHAMVVGELLSDATHDLDRRRFGRLLDLDDLEAP